MPNLKEYFNYKKFRSEPYRILFLNSRYFLQAQTIRTLKQLGHQVLELSVAGQPQQMLELLLKKAVEFKPDGIITFNHEGFDPEGKIAGVLNELGLPVLIWYLDDFRFILPDSGRQVYDNIFIYTFEKTNLRPLTDLGFEHVFYLPTASILDPRREFMDPQYRYLNHSTVFVGNSFQETVEKWNRQSYPERFGALKEGIDSDLYGENLMGLVREKQRAMFGSEETFYHYCGYVAARMTQLNRARILASVPTESLHVFGDQNWSQILTGVKLHSGVDQETVAPFVYGNAGININISSAQLNSAVNLRVFDIPAGGGFMITDWRDSLAELFDEKKELACYHDISDLSEMLNYYRSHPQRKADIILAANKRVNNEHLLIHRIKKMISIAAKILS